MKKKKDESLVKSRWNVRCQKAKVVRYKAKVRKLQRKLILEREKVALLMKKLNDRAKDIRKWQRIVEKRIAECPDCKKRMIERESYCSFHTAMLVGVDNSLVVLGNCIADVGSVFPEAKEQEGEE